MASGTHRNEKASSGCRITGIRVRTDIEAALDTQVNRRASECRSKGYRARLSSFNILLQGRDID